MITLDQAYEMGAKGAEPTEAERLLFEAWMHGHCWMVQGDWDGKTYVHATERNGEVNYHTMHTRQLWAAWRDRAALAEQPAHCAPAEDGVCEALDCPNHTPEPEKQAQQEPVSCPVCNQVHTILDADESQIIRNAKDGYPDGRTPRLLTLQERVAALCQYASDWKRWCLEKENTTPQAQPAQHQCNFPLCHSKEYQQAIAEQIKRELYTGEPAQRKPLTDELNQIAEDLRFHGLTLVKTKTGYAVLKLGQFIAHSIKENT